MNKFFAKIAGITAGLALVASAGVALANHAEAKGAKADAATMAAGTNGSACTVNGNDGIKVGTSKKGGDMTITVGSGATSLSFYAAAWNGVSGLSLNLTMTVGSATTTSFALTADSGVSNNSPFTLSGTESSYLFTTDLSSVTSESVITLASSTTKRFVVWNATYEVGGGEQGDTYKVTYNGNATGVRTVSNLPSAHTGLEDGASQSLSAGPTRWGYSFLGWGLTADATSYVTSVTINGADVIVYAIWEEDHTVAGAWDDSPYSVAEAKAAIDASTNLANVYVTGIISQIDSYNSTYHSITYWISADGTTTDQFEVYSGKGLNNANFSSVSDIEVGAEVVIYGTIKKYNSTYEFDKNNYQISYDAPSTGDIEVTFAPANFYGVGDNGSFSASTEASNPTYSFSSDNSSVISVTSAGVFEAVAAGSATVRVDVTSSEGNGYKEVAVTVVAVKTVSEAYEIAAGLASGATTDYSIKVSGWVSSLDADGKARAINFTDGAEVIEVFFGGGNADYTTVATNAKIGSEVTVFGKVQNYSGTYELKDITLEGVQGSDAVGFAAGAYKSLDGSCETGVDAVTQDQWTAINNGFDAIDSSEQAKFQEEDVTSYGTNVVNWVARYEIIVAHTSLSDFMSRGVSAARVVPGTTAVDSNVAVAVVAIVTIASISAIAVVLVIKRRRALEK